MWVFQIKKKKYSTDLHLAIRHQDEYASLEEKQKAVIKMIRRLPDKVDVNALNGQGRTALRLAIPRWYLQVVRLLLEMGADVNIPDENGDIALTTALIHWHSPRINAYTNAGDRELIRHTLSSLIKKSNLSFRNKQKQLPVYLAVRYRHPEAAAEIIQRGGTRSLTYKEYRVIIELAVKRGYTEVERVLEEELFNTVPIQSSQLYTAVEYYPNAAAEIILSGQAENLINREYRGLLNLAVQKGHNSLVSLLGEAYKKTSSSQEHSFQEPHGFFPKLLDFCKNTFSNRQML